MAKQPLMLMILDGFGIAPKDDKNAIWLANTPNLDRYIKECPLTTLEASGMSVGLPDGQMGNSEVGHTNIGAGRVVYQELTRITKAIAEKTFFENEALSRVMDQCKESNQKLHIMGLLSDGGVHSHNTHLYALLEMAKQKGLTEVYVHCFLDGRDVPPDSGLSYVRQLEEKVQEIGCGKIASVMGRYYAMDRDNRWDRVEKAYNAIALGKGVAAQSGAAAVEASYSEDILDEFVVPAVVNGGAPVEAGDGIIFFNFRPDRAREITRTFVDDEFAGFERTRIPVNFVCMTQYDAAMPNVDVAFRPQELKNTFGEYISEKGLKQLRIAETEKYAHVTFFFNGGVEQVYDGEERALIASPKVATYDLKPEMSAPEVTEELLRRIDSDLYDVIILNYANCDMVGHTGIMKAAIAAVEAVDTCAGKVIEKMLEKGGRVIITADHGNADKMIADDGGAFTAHTTNPVPMILVGEKEPVKLKHGRLCDLAPTMLDLLGLPIPAEMDGVSLIER